MGNPLARGLVVRVEGTATTIRYLEMVTTRVNTAIQAEAKQGAIEIRNRERTLAPVMQKAKKGAKWQGKKGPGYLRRSIVAQQGKLGITEMVRAKAPHSHFQEYGTSRGVKGQHFAEQARNELLSGIQQRILMAAAREVK